MEKILSFVSFTNVTEDIQYIEVPFICWDRLLRRLRPAGTFFY